MVALENDPTLSPSQVEPSPAAPRSDASQAWMGELRAGVRARLFADSSDPSAPVAPSPVAAEPARIGRYVVIKRIGAGGMGVVYAAYDDKLDRKVAVKLLRPGFGRVSETARARLLREAQSIARLSHRAIVQVYEVGTHEDEVFVAMEYVEGSTLKQWQPSRDWRDILSRYVAAGRGLCAAHAAGIVHRDFKADNVLVRASDLAVRVVDFGLARTEGEVGLDTTTPNQDDPEVSLTHTGMVMGTPAYMAPEQHLAKATDARTDQFSFCASLFEALYGYRAFAGERLDELRGNVLDGKVEAAPRYTAVPPDIHRALARGLSVDPGQRFPTMEALLAELELPPSRPWKRIAWALGLSAATIGAATTWSGTNADALSPDAIRVRAEFESALHPDARETLQRLENRTLPQRWNDVVLTHAARSTSATRTLGALAHLSTEDTERIEEARARAFDALADGPLFALRGTREPLVDVSFAPGSSMFAARTRSGGLLRWASADTPEPTPLEFERRVLGAAFSADGMLHVALSGGRLARVPARDTTATATRIHDAELTTIASDGGRRVAVGTEDGAVLLLTGDEVRPLHGHDAPITALRFDPSGETLASGDRSGRVSLWFLARDTHRTMGVDRAVTRLAWTGQQVVAQTSGGPAAWDGQRGTRAKVPFNDDLTAFDHAAHASVLVTASVEGLVATLEDGVRMPLDRSEDGNDLAVSDDGRWTASATEHGVKLWRTGSDAVGMQPTGAVHVSAKDSVVALHGRDQDTVIVQANGDLWSTQGDTLSLLAHVDVELRDARPSPDGRRLALEAHDGTLHVLTYDAQEPLSSLGQLDAPAPGAFAWSPDGGALAKLSCAPGHGQCVVSVHPVEGERARVWGETELTPFALQVSAGAQRIALVFERHVSVLSSDGSVKHVSANAPIRGVAFHPSDTLRFAWWTEAPAPTLVVQTLDADGTRHTLLEEPDLQHVTASEDGTALVLRTRDDRAVLWPLRDDGFVALPKGALDRLGPADVRLAADGTHLWIGSPRSRTVALIDLEHGLSRTVPRPQGPYAWRGDDVWVDVEGLQRVRTWGAAIPHDPSTFARWLSSRTRVTLPVSELQRVVSKPDERL